MLRRHARRLRADQEPHSNARATMPVRPRGVAIVAVVVLVVIIELLILGLVLSGARDQDLTVRRIEAVQSFYAAEAGMNMAIREYAMASDEDGDGTIGTISDDSDDGTDPNIGTAQVLVTVSVSGGVATLTSTGRDGQALRSIDVDAN